MPHVLADSALTACVCVVTHRRDYKRLVQRTSQAPKRFDRRIGAALLDPTDLRLLHARLGCQELLGMSKRSLYRLWDRGEGPRFCQVGRRRITRNDWLSDWLYGHEVSKGRSHPSRNPMVAGERSRGKKQGPSRPKLR